MANLMKRIEAEMTLMEGQRLIMGTNIPCNDVIEGCEEGIKRLQDLIEDVKRNPEEYKIKEKYGESLRGQLRIELVELQDDYFKSIGFRN